MSALTVHHRDSNVEVVGAEPIENVGTPAALQLQRDIRILTCVFEDNTLQEGDSIIIGRPTRTTPAILARLKYEAASSLRRKISRA